MKMNSLLSLTFTRAGLKGTNMITFIIGTDTGVGKTHYGMMLAEQGNTVIKPIETGSNSFDDLSESDSYTYSLIQNIRIKDINLYFFTEPLSPHFASEIDGAAIDIDKIKQFIHSNEDIFVELAGGLMVPITREYTQLDLIKDTPNCCVDIVVANKLGCINHSLLTISVLKHHNIKIRNIFFNDLDKEMTPAMEDNIRVIKDFLSNS